MYLLQHTYTFAAVNDCTSYISFTVIYRKHFENVHFYIYIDYQNIFELPVYILLSNSLLHHLISSMRRPSQMPLKYNLKISHGLVQFDYCL